MIVIVIVQVAQIVMVVQVVVTHTLLTHIVMKAIHTVIHIRLLLHHLFMFHHRSQERDEFIRLVQKEMRLEELHSIDGKGKPIEGEMVFTPAQHHVLLIHYKR